MAVNSRVYLRSPNGQLQFNLAISRAVRANRRLTIKSEIAYKRPDVSMADKTFVISVRGKDVSRKVRERDCPRGFVQQACRKSIRNGRYAMYKSLAKRFDDLYARIVNSAAR